MKRIIGAIVRWMKGKGPLSAVLRLLLLLVIVLVVLPLLFILTSEGAYEFRDKGGADGYRGGAILDHDKFGDHFSSIKYLDQGWKPEDSLWFYNTTQGSDLLPYDLFMEVEQVGKQTVFRDNENMNLFGYLAQKPTTRNPDGLPVGFTKDTFLKRDYLGYTCAACHTGQVNYNGVGMRIDGGPSSADVDGFVRALAAALLTTQNDPTVLGRFVKRVIARGNYRSENDVIDALKTTTQELTVYNTINASSTAYGYARLDAFGRIYNRVLEHVLTSDQFRELLQGVVPDAKLNAALAGTDGALSGIQRDRIYNLLSPAQLGTLKLAIANEPNAPVSYPFLWDISQHDYVQWNGLVANAGLGAVGRNTGEVIGVFATLDWKRKSGFSLTSLITGQGFKTHVSFDSSINVHNLRRIEARLGALQSPVWPQDLLPKIDAARKANGELLFAQYCSACHSEINRADPLRRVVAHMSSIDHVGTDDKMANNSMHYVGLSGILRNEYAHLDVGDILLDEHAPAVGLLTKATLGVVATPYPYENPIRRGVNWSYDLIYAFFTNEIRPSLKSGEYDSDTLSAPIASFHSYKARPLNGIWATSPYLHNGSVPTLYDLLLPKKRPGDPADGEYRPDTFMVGSREFDPIHVGLKNSGYDGFVFDTSIPGNGNAGHEYTSGRTPEPGGTVLPALNQDQRMDLLEYLKSL